MAERTTERRRDPALHRTEIVEAAAHAFMKEGFASTSVDDIARSLGCTKGRIYYYFKNKTELFFAVHEETIEGNLDSVRPIALGDEGSLLKLEQMVRRHITNIIDRLPFQRVSLVGLEMQIVGRTTEEERNILDRLIQSYREYEQLFFTVVEQGMLDGVFEKGDADTVVKSMLGAMNWMIMWYRPRTISKAKTNDNIVDNMTAYIMRGLVGKG